MPTDDSCSPKTEEEFKRLLLSLSDENRCINCKRPVVITRLSNGMMAVDSHCWVSGLHLVPGKKESDDDHYIGDFDDPPELAGRP